MKIQSIETFSVNSVQEFIKLKKTPLFHKYRQLAKSVGLAFLFGRGSLSFALRDLEVSWTEEQADAFIEANDLHDSLQTIFERKRTGKEPLTLFQAKLAASAAFIRRNFYKTYPGLEDRIRVNREFAKEHGYVRSVFGALRRVPQLILSGKDDSERFGEEFANLSNVVTNTDIQNFESGSINRPIAIISDWLEKNGMNSKILAQVHDAVYFYAHRSELDALYTKVKAEFERRYPEQWEIPLVIEEKVSDLDLGGFYGSGVSYEKYKELVK